MSQRLFLFLLIGFGMLACNKVKINKNLAAELTVSPEIIVLGENHLILDSYMWRDFMPVAEEDGSPLICTVKLMDKDSLSFDFPIELVKLYIINNNEVWKTNYELINNDVEFQITGQAKGGPKWGPNIEVDVVCEFKAANKTYKILQKSQLIHQTM